MLIGLLCNVFIYGAGAWMKSRRQVEIIQNLNVSFIWIEKELRASDIKSVELANYLLPLSSISFLSGYDINEHRIAYDDILQKIKWKRYILYYLDTDKVIAPGTNSYHPGGITFYKLMRREISLGIYENTYSSDFVSNLYYPPDGVPPDSTCPMTHYITAPKDSYTDIPRTISRNITFLEFAITGKKVRFHMKVQVPHGNDKIEIDNNILIRNNS